MDLSKANHIVPVMASSLDEQALSQFSSQEQTLLKEIDGHRSIAVLVERTALPIKDLLLQLKTLAKQGVVSLKKRKAGSIPPTTVSESSAASPTSVPASNAPTPAPASAAKPKMPKMPKMPKRPKLPKLPKGAKTPPTPSTSPQAPGGPRLTPPPTSAPPAGGGFRAVVSHTPSAAGGLAPVATQPQTEPTPAAFQERPRLPRRTTSVPKPDVLTQSAASKVAEEAIASAPVPVVEATQSAQTSAPPEDKAPPTPKTPPVQGGTKAPEAPRNAFAIDPNAVEALLGVSMEPVGEVSTPEIAEVTRIAPSDRRLDQEEEYEDLHEPGEQQASANLSPQALKVNEILRGLARVTVSFQLYDLNNDAVRDALEDLNTLIMTYLMNNADLKLRVEPYSFYFGNERVYVNDDRESSLAFKLFRDGVRGLRFTKGMHWTELAEVLQILGMRYGGVHMFEDDIVTLFWKAELKHVEIVAVEGFEHQREEGDTSLNPFASLFERFLTKGRSKSAPAMPTPDKDVPMIFRGMTQGALLSAAVREENGVGLSRQLKAGPVTFRPIAAKRCIKLLQENSLEMLPEQVFALLRVVDRYTAELVRATELSGLEHLLEQYMSYLISDSKHDAIVGLFTFCERWAALVDIRKKHLGPIANKILASLQDRNTLIRFIKSIKLNTVGEVPDSSLRLMKWEGHSVVDRLFGILEEEEQSESFKMTIRKLLIRLETNPNPYVERMGRTSEFTIELIKCLQMLGTPEAIKVLASQVAHYDKRVQDVIFEMAEEIFQGPEWVGPLREVVNYLLNSKKKEERERGYLLIEKHGDRLWAPILFKRMEEADVELNELKQIASMAARLHPRGAQSQMIKLASPPKLLSLESHKRKLQRYAAIAALGEIATEQAEDAVRKLLEKGDTEYKEDCVRALRQIRKGGGTSQKAKSSNGEAGEDSQLAGGERTRVKEVDISKLQSQMIRSLSHVDRTTGQEFNAHIRELGHHFVHLIHMLQKTATLYDEGNVIFRRPIREITEALEALIEQLMHVSLVAVEGQFYINDIRVRMQGDAAAQIGGELFHVFESIKLGGMNFGTPLTEDEWKLALQIFAGRDGKIRHWHELRDKYKVHDLDKKIELFGPVVYKLTGDEEEKKKALTEVYSRGVYATESIWKEASRGQAPDALPVRRFINEMVDILEGRGEQVYELLALEDPDEPLKTHLMHVAIYSMRIGAALGLNRTQLADLGIAAYFHDIGHVILSSVDEESNENWTSLNHQQAGLGLLLKYKGFHEAKIKRLLAVVEHHTNAAPNRKGQQPALYSRIIRVADTYETLTSNMMGDKPISPARAISLIAGETEKRLDPIAAQAFVNMMGRYPFGSLLELEDGSLAVSIGPDGGPKEFTRPRVILARDPDYNIVLGPMLKLTDPKYADQEISRVHESHDEVDPKQHLVKYLKRRTDVNTLLAK